MNGKIKLKAWRGLSLALLGTTLLLNTCVSAYAQATGPSGPPHSPPPTYVPEIPPVVIPPRVEPPRVMIPPQIPTNITTPVLPVDVTNVVPDLGAMQNSVALNGVTELPEDAFPKQEEFQGSTDWIVVRVEPGSEVEKTSPYAVTLKSGRVIVSVRKPSKMAMVDTPFGQVNLSSDADALVSVQDGVMRVASLNTHGADVVKIRIGSPVYDSPKVLALKAGFELTASDHKLNRSDLRPKDELARRHFKLLHDGKLAVSELSVESFLNSATLVATITQKENGTKEKRVLADLSKMAAVLNYMNGSGGYTVQAK